MQDEVGDQVLIWRNKAEELRTVADQIRNPMARASYRRMADTYETLANQTEERAARHRGSGLG
jgi:hypothetical protein